LHINPKRGAGPVNCSAPSVYAAASNASSTSYEERIVAAYPWEFITKIKAQSA